VPKCEFHFSYFDKIYLFSFSSTGASTRSADSDVELKSSESGFYLEPVGADTEVPVRRQHDRIPSGHYEEIVESESPPEQPTSGDDVEESTSEYAGLDPVAVAESRARPAPVYEGLGRR